MSTMSKLITINNLTDFKILENELMKRWLDLEDNPTAFRYKLNIRAQKILDGKFHFFTQLNTDRTEFRRAPQTITSIVQPFNEHVFNFKKINDCEVLVHCQTQIDSQSQLNFEPSENGITTFLINNSPLTKFHSLVCPRLNDGLPQIMTKECIELAIDLIAGLNDHSYRIGYNSLGAFSSVNHLHLHLIHVTENLYVEDAELTQISGDIYKMDSPVFALCLPLFQWSDKAKLVNILLKMIEYFCLKSIPHNIFWTFGTHNGQRIIKTFIFPRTKLSDKPKATFNAAFCELAGYVPIGDPDAYAVLTEDVLVDQLSAAMGPVDSEQFVTEILRICSNGS